MKKYLIALVLLVALIINVACNPNGENNQNDPNDPNDPGNGEFKVEIGPQNVFSDNPSEKLNITVNGAVVSADNYTCYYTLDGSDPTENSDTCEAILKVKRPTERGFVTVKVLVVHNGTGGKATTETLVIFGRYTTDFVMQNHDGTAVALSEMTHEYLHVDFGAEWCDGCKAQAGSMKGIIQEIHNQGYSFESITTVVLDQNSENPKLELLEKWHTEYGMKYIVRDYVEGAYDAFGNAYGNSNGYPYNVLLKYNTDTKKYEKVASGFDVYSASNLTSLMTKTN